MRTARYLVSIGMALAIAACGDNLVGNRAPDINGQSVNTPEDSPVTITQYVETMPRMLLEL